MDKNQKQLENLNKDIDKIMSLLEKIENLSEENLEDLRKEITFMESYIKDNYEFSNSSQTPSPKET